MKSKVTTGSITSIPIEVACPEWWHARKKCSEWSYGTTYQLHGCGLKPGHTDSHKCPCGARKPQKDESSTATN